jgi:hypothetical protein
VKVLFSFKEELLNGVSGVKTFFYIGIFFLKFFIKSNPLPNPKKWGGVDF